MSAGRVYRRIGVGRGAVFPVCLPSSSMFSFFLTRDVMIKFDSGCSFVVIYIYDEYTVNHEMGRMMVK